MQLSVGPIVELAGADVYRLGANVFHANERPDRTHIASVNTTRPAIQTLRLHDNIVFSAGGKTKLRDRRTEQGNYGRANTDSKVHRSAVVAYENPRTAE